MQNILLVIHLILALCLIAIVLLQRSEGGGLGIGGGGGGGNSSRPPANAMTKLTWAFATAFLCTSIGLGVIAAQEANNSSVLDASGLTLPSAETGSEELTDGILQLPPTAEDGPTAPPRAE